MPSITGQLDREYAAFLGELKARIVTARLKAARTLNRELILLYWDLGRGILQKQFELGWGESVIERIGKDLQSEFPGVKGFSSRNLRSMRQFYQSYSTGEFWLRLAAKLPERPAEGETRFRLQSAANLQGETEPQTESEFGNRVRQLVAEVPWGHHLLILNKVDSPAARLYYLQATTRFGWTRNVLLNQIKAGAHARSLAEGKSHNFPAVLPEYLAEQAEETLKSSYNLEFLGISRQIKEQELEERLTERLKDFILELGYGFCFAGRQYRLTLGRKEYFIDLLFYHRFLKSLVAIELKIGPFEPEFVGKMDFYLNLLNEKERGPGDNQSIGIILCAEKDNLEVEFALKSKTNPIGVAEYHLQPTLPRELEGKLPTPKQLTAVVREVLPGKAPVKRKTTRRRGPG